MNINYLKYEGEFSKATYFLCGAWTKIESCFRKDYLIKNGKKNKDICKLGEGKQIDKLKEYLKTLINIVVKGKAISSKEVDYFVDVDLKRMINA